MRSRKNRMHDALASFSACAFSPRPNCGASVQMLRLALLEELSRLASDAANAQQHREAAYLWADRLMAGARRGQRISGRQCWPDEPGDVRPQRRLPVGFVGTPAGRRRRFPAFQIALEQDGRSLTECVRAENTQEAYRSGAAARAFGSLRALARLDIRKVFERVSIVDEELRQRRIRQFTRRAILKPATVAARPWKESRTGPAFPSRRWPKWRWRSRPSKANPSLRQVPYFLVADGIAALERKAGAHLPFRVTFCARRPPSFRSPFICRPSSP